MDSSFEEARSEEQAKELARLKLYQLLLKKYSDLIGEKEKRTIGGIKGLIDPDNLTIQSIIADFKGADYSFESGFLPAAEKCFVFLQKEILFAKPDIEISFWLTPEEIIENKVSDDEDLAVFLCSMLLALGDEDASVAIAELDNYSTHAFVITNFGGKFLLLDSCQQESFQKFVGEREAVLENYSFRGAKLRRFIYKFNRNAYEQFF